MQHKFCASNNTISLKKKEKNKGINYILCDIYNLGWVTVSDDRFYSTSMMT